MTLLPDPTLEDTPEKIQFVQVANEHVMETTEKSRKRKLRRTWSLHSREHGHCLRWIVPIYIQSSLTL